MVNMKDIAVCYDKISAFDMLVDIAKVAGIESIQAALNEIATQQSVNADVMPCGHPLAESYQGEDGGKYCRICESA